MSVLFFKPKKTGPQSDDMLIAEYKRTGNSFYVGELFNRYAYLVFGVCMKYMKDEDLAQDLTMAVFEKLMADLKHHEVQHFKSWLYMVSKNQCLMYFRKEKGNATLELNTNKSGDEEEDSVEIADTGHPEDTDMKEFRLQHLEAGIVNLNHEQKMCIELFYLQNKSYVEITEITGYDMRQVKSYIQNGKRNLKLFMEKEDES